MQKKNKSSLSLKIEALSRIQTASNFVITKPNQEKRSEDPSYLNFEQGFNILNLRENKTVAIKNVE